MPSRRAVADPISKFDGLEVMPLLAFDTEGDLILPGANTPVAFYDQLESENDRAKVKMWSVMGHLPAGGVDDIAECYNEVTAIAVAKALYAAYPNLKSLDDTWGGEIMPPR